MRTKRTVHLRQVGPAQPQLGMSGASIPLPDLKGRKAVRFPDLLLGEGDPPVKDARGSLASGLLSISERPRSAADPLVVRLLVVLPPCAVHEVRDAGLRQPSGVDESAVRPAVGAQPVDGVEAVLANFENGVVEGVEPVSNGFDDFDVVVDLRETLGLRGDRRPHLWRELAGLPAGASTRGHRVIPDGSLQ